MIADIHILRAGGITHLKAGGDRSKESVEKASGVGEYIKPHTRGVCALRMALN